MTNPSFDITSMLGSRICHDLISPLGAISNGLELHLMSGGPKTPEMELIEQSVANANTRIKFFRIAFGIASPDQMVGAGEITEILQGMCSSGRNNYRWASGIDLGRADAKLMFLLMLCVESALPFGGEISAYYDNGKLVVSGNGSEIRINPDYWNFDAEADDQMALNPAMVQFTLAAKFAKDDGKLLRVNSSAERIEITVS